MDSTHETRAHIARVQSLLGLAIADLGLRAVHHDGSKLEQPEKAVFDAFTPRLRSTKFDSAKYAQNLVDMGPALAHHYAHNRHHPEWHDDGIAGMNLVDLLEMLADWKAATERRADSDLAASIEEGRERFGYGDQLANLLHNTAAYFGWLA